MQSLDYKIKYHHLMLKIKLDNIQDYQLPNGYSFVFYNKGDEKYWKEIEISSQDCIDNQEANYAWDNYYKINQDLLYDRLIFIVDTKTNEKVATATSYFNTWTNNQKEGFLHFVAIKKDYQGKKLAKPLISFALKHLKKLGYDEAFISTQTNTWLAAKLYLDFGAFPNDLDNEKEGFEILKAILKEHKSLDNIKPNMEIYDELNCQVNDILLSIHKDLTAFKVNNKRIVKAIEHSYCYEYEIITENSSKITINDLKLISKEKL